LKQKAQPSRFTGIVSRYRFYPIGLGLAVLGAFLIRVIPQWDKVFTDRGVMFLGNDPWFHMRLADVMMENFPWLMTIDPFRDGGGTYNPLLTYMIAMPGQIGLNYEVWAALLPAILGALILVPVYFLGREIFNSRGIGLFSAVLVGIMPTELLHRSQLGFTDHHVLEVLLATSVILFLVLSAKRGQLRYMILAGVSLGLFSLAWNGFLIMLPIIMIWLGGMFIYNYWTDKSSATLVKTVAITGSITTLMFLPYYLVAPLPSTYIVALLVFTAMPLMLHYLGKLRDRRVFIGSLVGATATGLLIVALALPGVFEQAISLTIRVFIPGAGFGTVSEVKPTNFPLIISAYGATFFLFVGGIVHGIVTKKAGALVIVWTVAMFAIMIAERRWGYYFVVPAALFSTYFLWVMLKGLSSDARIGAAGVLALIVLIPAVAGMYGTVTTADSMMTPEWHSSCAWLRENTPEPFSNSTEAYYLRELDKEPEYEVMSWWDWGFFILREGHRVPVSDPGQRSVAESAEFLVDGVGDPEYVILGDHRNIYPAFEVWLGRTPTPDSIYSSYYYKLYFMGDPDRYTLVHQEGQVKIFERRDNEEIY